MTIGPLIMRCLRFLLSCFCAVFGDCRLSPYDPVMQVIPPAQLFFDVAAVALLALASRLVIIGFMATVAIGYTPVPSLILQHLFLSISPLLPPLLQLLALRLQLRHRHPPAADTGPGRATASQQASQLNPQPQL
jgi:hypothetical protein